MSRIDVVIVDDEPAARRTLRECCMADPGLEVVGEYGDPTLALAAIRAAPPQLLFLDIQMSSMSGIELARALDPATLPLIVFVTAYDHYALEAFDVSAIDYLLKPFDHERFARTIERVKQRHAAGNPADRATALDALIAALDNVAGRAPEQKLRLLAATHGRQILLDPSQVQLVEADRNYVRLRVGSETLQARATLQQIEEALQAQPILRVSRSCIVNTAYVREINRTPRGDFILVMTCGVTVTSSEGFRERVRTYLDRLRI